MRTASSGPLPEGDEGGVIRDWVLQTEADELPVAEVIPNLLGHQAAALAQADAIGPPRHPLLVEQEGKQFRVRLLSEPGQNTLLLEERRTAIDPTTLERFGLSRREAEVLAWVAQGKTNGEIGIILGISPRTVGKHLEQIFHTLGVETRTAAALMATSAPPSQRDVATALHTFREESSPLPKPRSRRNCQGTAGAAPLGY